MELRIRNDSDFDEFARDQEMEAQPSRSSGIIQVVFGTAILIALIVVERPIQLPRVITDYMNSIQSRELAEAVPLISTPSTPPGNDIGTLVADNHTVPLAGPLNLERNADAPRPQREATAAPAIRSVSDEPPARVPEPPPPTIIATADGPIEVPPASVPESVTPQPSPFSATAAAAASTAVDEQSVKQALQRYRSAYDRLDARLARSVWPTVNEAQLARAFDSLQSQSLTFTACDVSFRGTAAVATCEGTMRYTPRIGSHDSRVEPHVWTFTLRKRGPDWQIDSVKAAR
jgi:hypothetical protein